MATTKVTSGGITDATIATADIADQAVTLAKLPHGTSSNDGKFLRANNGADPTFETVSGTTINNNADNRVITGSGTANTLNAESGVQINSNGRMMVNGTYGAGMFNVTGETALGLDAKRQFLGIDSHNDDMNIRATYYSGGASGAAYPDIKFTTSDSERLRITAGGNIGIGGTAPNYQLHATTNIAVGAHGFAQQLVLGNNSIQSLLLGTGYTNLSLNASGGNVGIGTTSPGKPLDVVGEIRGNAFVGRSNISAPSADASIYRAADNTLAFATASTERMRINSSGKVGIGVVGHDPLTALHVQGNSNAALLDVLTLTNSPGSSGTEVGMVFECGADEIARISAKHEGSDVGPLIFSTASSQTANPTEKMRLDKEGGLRINCTGAIIADELLSVHEDGTAHELCGFRVNSQSHNKDMITMAHVANSNDRMFMRFKRTGSLTNVGSINTNPSVTAFNTSSDYRLKENEVLISDGITRLKQLKPYRFNFKIEPDRIVDGFYAHEVTPVVPEAVTGQKDAMEVETYYEEGDTLPEGKSVGDPKKYSTTKIDPQGLDYAKFTPLLTAALQEEISKREALEARVAALEAA